MKCKRKWCMRGIRCVVYSSFLLGKIGCNGWNVSRVGRHTWQNNHMKITWIPDTMNIIPALDLLPPDFLKAKKPKQQKPFNLFKLVLGFCYLQPNLILISLLHLILYCIYFYVTQYALSVSPCCNEVGLRVFTLFARHWSGYRNN